MDGLDLQSLGMRLGEAITPTPRDAPQVRYGTIDAVNADGTLDVTIDGTTLRGMCATTGCVGAQAGMRCLVLRQGALATVIDVISHGAPSFMCYVTNAIANFSPPSGMTGCLVLDTTDYGMYWHDGAGFSRLNPGQQPIAVSPNAVACTSGTWKDVCSVTVPAGVWLFLYGGGFVSNATGYRQVHFGTSLSAGRYSPSYAAASGDQTRIQGSAVDVPTGNTTYHLWARQNSGTALDFYGWIRAARIR